MNMTIQEIFTLLCNVWFGGLITAALFLFIGFWMGRKTQEKKLFPKSEPFDIGPTDDPTDDYFIQEEEKRVDFVQDFLDKEGINNLADNQERVRTL